MCCKEKKTSGIGWILAWLFAILYTICFVWYWIRGGGAAIQELHTNLFKLAFFGFSEMNAVSFVSGFVQAFIWGWIVAAIWKPLHTKLCYSSPAAPSGTHA
jgi:hypothetical protein